MTNTTADIKSASMANPKRPLVAAAVFAILGLIGVACWVMQITNAAPLALDNHVVWGLYITGFTVCTGIAGGCLLFTSFTILFPVFQPLRDHARLSALVAVAVGVVGAGLFIIADLGTPARFWEMVAYAQPGSPLFWDMVVLLAYLAVGIALIVRLGKEGSDAALKALAVIALIAGLCVAVTSFVFAFQVARPLWNNPGQTISFVFSACIAAFSLLLLVFTAVANSKSLPFDASGSAILAKATAALVAIELIYVAAEIASGLFAATGHESATALWLVSGPGAVFFWLEVAAFGISLGLLMQKQRSLQCIGATLAFAGVILVKYNLVQVALYNPLLDMTSFMHLSGIVEGFYAPSLIEWGVAAGIIGISGVLLTAGISKLKING